MASRSRKSDESARAEAKIIDDRTGVFSPDVKSKGRDVISCKEVRTLQIRIAGTNKEGRVGSSDRVMYVTLCTANTCTSIERKEKSTEREIQIERERETSGSENGKSEYGMRTYVWVYFAEGRSAGGATGAGKNVLRTLDITGSNVTRSRRENCEPAFRGAERSAETAHDEYRDY